MLTSPAAWPRRTSSTSGRMMRGCCASTARASSSHFLASKELRAETPGMQGQRSSMVSASDHHWGIRSITVTADRRVLLANVHVGGIPGSTDGGSTWHPTIDIGTDVHEVCAHPTDAGIVIAAAAVGVCVSHDGGASWTIEHDGLHASYCSAVAVLGHDLLVAASTDHFAPLGAIHRRPLDGRQPFEPMPGLPRWLDGIADTRCIATHASAAAVADRAGNLWLSRDSGQTWVREGGGPPGTLQCPHPSAPGVSGVLQPVSCPAACAASTTLAGSSHHAGSRCGHSANHAGARRDPASADRSVTVDDPRHRWRGRYPGGVEDSVGATWGIAVGAGAITLIDSRVRGFVNPFTAETVIVTDFFEGNQGYVPFCPIIRGAIVARCPRARRWRITDTTFSTLARSAAVP